MPDNNVRSFLEKEQAELNSWCRTINQIYFTWYGTFIALSGAALAWAFPEVSDTSKHLDFRILGYAAMTFALWSILGFLVAIPVVQYVWASDKRIGEIIKLLDGGEGTASVLRSPIPKGVATFAYLGTMITLLSLFIIWVVLSLKLRALAHAALLSSCDALLRFFAFYGTTLSKFGTWV